MDTQKEQRDFGTLNGHTEGTERFLMGEFQLLVGGDHYGGRTLTWNLGTWADTKQQQREIYWQNFGFG